MENGELRIMQVIQSDEGLVVLRDDNTLWRLIGDGWAQIPMTLAPVCEDCGCHPSMRIPMTMWSHWNKLCDICKDQREIREKENEVRSDN